MKWTEAEIQALKAQEAKDLAVEFLEILEAKEKGPISPGEVQLKELDFNVRLREAEIEDRRRRESHEKQIKELELQIQQEKTRAAEAEEMANQVRQTHARVIERVAEATESLSTQLERATRTHNLKLEQLTAAFATKEEDLSRQLRDLGQTRDALRDEISTLTDLRGEALEIGHLREEIERRKKETRREHADVEEQVAAAEFEKTKRIRDAERKLELELAWLEAQHQKDVLLRNRQAAEGILAAIDMIAVEKDDWDQLNQRLAADQARSDGEVQRIRAETRDEFRREFNITRAEPLDVTDLFYREQAARTEAERLRIQLDKLDAEIRRMHQHIEHEPERIAAAVEAAKTPVQNYIEQSGKR
jgi:chromosome segregation ATPase